jgi:hypothetical protein
MEKDHSYIEKLKVILKNNQEANMYSPKPPLGVVPEKVYEMNRIYDLSRIIYEYCEFDCTQMDFKNTDSILMWTNELISRLNNLKNIE